MLGVVDNSGERDLVAEVGAFDLDAVDRMRPGPALRRTQHDRRPGVALARAGPVECLLGARLGTHRENVALGAGQGGIQIGEDLAGVVTFDKDRLPALATQVGGHVLIAGAAEDSRAGDLVAVEVDDRDDRAVAARVEEVRQAPRRGQRAGLGFAVADDAGDEEIRVVHGGPAGVDQGVPEFAALMDRPGCLHADVAGNASGRRELAAQATDARGVRANARVDLRIRALEPAGGDQRGAAVPRPGDVEPVGVGGLDDPVQDGIDHRQARAGTPVPEQPRLDVFGPQRLADQDVVLQIDLPDRQIVRGLPPPQVEVEFGVGIRAQCVGVPHAFIQTRWRRAGNCALPDFAVNSR